MKETYSFPVVGSVYFSEIQTIKDELKEGVFLNLVHEPTNPFDTDAIAVFFKETHIGYIPNRGISCSKCWSYVSSKDYYCKKCDASNAEFIKGGLATRLIQSKAFFKDKFCYISKVNPDAKNILVEGILEIDL